MSRIRRQRRVSPALTLGLAAIAAIAASASRADPLPSKPLLADQHAPAGVNFEHMHKKGEVMVGFRYAGSFAGGDMLHGTKSVNDQDVIDNGCPGHSCAMKPSEMTMNMYMLDIMYAPSDWMTLMVMPMWMSHEMTMVPLKGTPSVVHDGLGMDTGHGAHTGAHSHGTEGWG